MATEIVSRQRQESLHRAVSSQSLLNYPEIFAGFAAKGIPESDIQTPSQRFHLQRMEGARSYSS